MRQAIFTRVLLGGVALAALAGLAAVSPARAEYSIPVSTFSEAAGRAAAGPYEIAFTAGQVSPIGATASGTLALVSGILPLTMDLAPPEILHEPPALAAAGRTAVIEADVEDLTAGVDSVALHYHLGGLTSFKRVRMEAASGPTYEAVLPAQDLTERGLAYYIEATDRMGNMSTYPAGAPDSLENLPVYFAALPSDLNLPARAYRMISVPGTPTHGSPDSVLVDDYGAYDRKAWRLGRWNPAGSCTAGCYDEYPEIADLAPGKAFWLIMDSPRMFDLSGISTDASRPCRVPLERGWNQIGTPFAFGTRWASGWVEYNGARYSLGEEYVVGVDTILVEDNLIGYDGSYQSFQTHLGAWTGYWVYNASTQDVQVRFPPVIEEGWALESIPALGETDALLAIEAAWQRPDESMSRSVCYAGLAEGARYGRDPRDLHAPPALDGDLTVAFVKTGWGRLSGRYMSDVRPSSGQGHTWTVTVEAPGDIYAAVTVTTAGGLPQGWEAVLYDPARGIRMDRLDRAYALHVPGRAELTLAAGTPEFLRGEEAESRIALKTQLISLTPNPFTEELSLTFHLSTARQVSIQVFGIDGSLVATPAEGVLGPGVHTASWDGRTSAGQPAASGVYFVRMAAGDATVTGKVIKLK